MFIPIIVLSEDGDNDSSMGGVDDEFNNWSFDKGRGGGEEDLEWSNWSEIFYKRKGNAEN